MLKNKRVDRLRLRCKHVTFVSFVTLLSFPAASHGEKSVLDRSRQCVVVVTDDWASTAGTLRTFERDHAAARWMERGEPVRVVLGKNGLGQGRGLLELDLKGAPTKKEGDNKAPAGIFRLPLAFGYELKRAPSWVKLPYRALSEQTEGIDDPGSHYYNELIERSEVPRVDWRTSERMRRDDNLYKWGMFVEHNPMAVPGAGSCIFLHVWKNSNTATTGCTAMAEKDILRLLRWLDPARKPVLVQMPENIYRSIRPRFGLP